MKWDVAQDDGNAERDGVSSVWTRRVTVGLLLLHAALLLHSVVANSVTIDEIAHLPVGISYWQRGEFWAYHHNPPLIRLLVAFPAVLADVPIDYTGFAYRPFSRQADCELGKTFMLENANHYMAIFAMCRVVVVGMSVLAGYLVFSWSRALFGNAGGLISLALWVVSPNVLAHAGLLTPDLGATAVGFLATYMFWRYLRKPSSRGAILSGVFLGLAEASKFSFVTLPVIWIALVAVKLCTQRRTLPKSEILRAKACFPHAILLTLASLVIVNDVYLWEGTGTPLGSLDFRSNLLGGRKIQEDTAAATAHGYRGNRFRGTMLERLPSPLPLHFLLGFDDQMFDVDCGFYFKYLRGDLRRGPGWWYYYLYCALVKSPVGTLVLLGVAGFLVLFRKYRSDPVSDAALILPILVFMISVSSGTGLNSHFRYVLPAFPFAFVFAGRLGRLCGSPRSLATALIGVLLVSNGVSVLRVHPHYLTYFNEVAGGPRNGLYHLADSNIDWGQGLIALRSWLKENHPGEKVYLAYFGTMFPEVLGIEYEMPPFEGPVPGLHAVSANYLLGIPFPAPNGEGVQETVPLNTYTYYRRFTPIAVPGNSIYVYRLEIAEVNAARRAMGLPECSVPGSIKGE